MRTVGNSSCNGGAPIPRAGDDDDTSPTNIFDVPSPPSEKMVTPTKFTTADLRLSFQKQKAEKPKVEEASDDEFSGHETVPYNPYPPSEVDETARGSEDPFTPDKKAPNSPSHVTTCSSYLEVSRILRG